MTHKIAHILGDLGDKAAAEIAKLETALGWPSEDVRLLALSHSQVRQKLKQLRLDPDDTRPKELYHALATRFSTDCQNLDKALKIGQATYSQKIHIAVELAKLCLKGQMLWTLKNSHIKQMLRAQPPVQTKKLLQFRSLESMLKRADIRLVLLIAELIESPTWQAKFDKQLSQSMPSDWQLSPITIMALNLSPESNQTVVSNQPSGSIAVFYHDQPTLVSLAQILQSASQLVGKDMMAQLGTIYPPAAWWADNSHLVAWLDDQPVSLNLFDVAASFQVQDYEGRSFEHAGQHLWHKLLEQYRAYSSEQMITAAKSIGLDHSQQLAPQMAIAEDADVV
ncbi:hypothetical protein A3F65_01865 [Candidatus Saccharibacteria bacterium RIFCSPHIGHO2_12_FULL_47_16b]|nr:MAG: hypothetical protein A3F65_01865 [Candidatus Saccharibacteria bacterium RIFCSPHIGHO2_12_FULL_47_16b]OGL39770.1 MAG: hypothetical protein A3J32_02275 [Candidatus Saccharibacteria bacterium RIFCSPLOWO2_02_FULL_46_7]